MLQLVGYATAGALLVLGMVTVGTVGRDTEVDGKAVAPPKPVVSEPCGATMLEYLKLRRGMTYPEVKRTIGCGGEILSQVDLGGTTSVMLQWDASNSFIGSMTTTFQNGQLVAWAQFGLR